MDVQKETMISLLEEALTWARLASWRPDVDPAGRITALRHQLNQPFATMIKERLEAALVVRPRILELFETCCASGDPVAALDKFIGAIEKQLEDLGVDVRGPGYRKY